jgi:endonuclease YncB( thermonuclease family)
LLTICILNISIPNSGYEHYLHPIIWESIEVRVIDGDTLKLDGKSIRLQGIDAPELKQKCNLGAEEVYCGEQAHIELERLVFGKKVGGTDEGIDKYRRQLSYCYVNGNSINRAMVKTGHARSYRNYDLLFIFDEIYAFFHQAGLWVGGFEEPWLLRKK